ncbi:hypothetical protein MHI43_26005 [Paenibacillus sp. FSL H8-0457]|uniref:hypothetical protein n=1 Tax=unclassified Paenibacillus TaxID=185978 RepID=UPI0003E1F2F4|nr:hypothetical protein [Paenibacillus sp. FSL H8-457]ETT68847.1 hypothetical protein C172_03902 [Paenibacillus sp. FSL H8-457]
MIQTDVKKFIRDRALKKTKTFWLSVAFIYWRTSRKRKNGQPREIKSKKTDENKN